MLGVGLSGLNFRIILNVAHVAMLPEPCGAWNNSRRWGSLEEFTTKDDSTMNLSDFQLSPERGFLPHADPLRRLPAAFDAWEDLALGLPKFLMGDDLRGRIERLPDFPLEKLQTQAEWQRAMCGLSYLGHAYVWTGEAAQSIPAKLAKPWCAVAAKLGRPPVLSYESYALDNWYRFDPEGPIECGNIGLIQNFYGGADEEWFILIHVDIEKKASQAISAVPGVLAAAQGKDEGALAQGLHEINRSMEAMYIAMERMPEFCDPYVYFHRVRPYIHGWKNNPATPNGMLYEGEFGGVAQHYHGETGAQSAIMPTLDALLGVYHEDDPLKEYLIAMRDYMPPLHRKFMEAVAEASTVRQGVEGMGSTVQAEYNESLDWVQKFRTIHLEYAAKYIFSQIQTTDKNPTEVGTGGTPFMKYLKKHRDETREHALS